MPNLEEQSINQIPVNNELIPHRHTGIDSLRVNVKDLAGRGFAIGSGTNPTPGGATIKTSINCGFRPSLIMVRAFINAVNNHAFSIGEAVINSNGQCMASYSFGTNTFATNDNGGGIISLFDTSGTQTVYAIISNITDSGFEINWQVASQVATYQWTAIA